MWNLKKLIEHSNNCTVLIDGHYVPARPLNGQPSHSGILIRLRDAWAVFCCKAEAFSWPSNQ